MFEMLENVFFENFMYEIYVWNVWWCGRDGLEHGITCPLLEFPGFQSESAVPPSPSRRLWRFLKRITDPIASSTSSGLSSVSMKSATAWTPCTVPRWAIGKHPSFWVITSHQLTPKNHHLKKHGLNFSDTTFDYADILRHRFLCTSTYLHSKKKCRHLC